jgi:L-lactate permease
MEYALYFITFGFGGALLLYAILLRLTLNVRLLPRYNAVQMKDPKAYVKTFSHIIAFLALALLAGGWVGTYAGPLIGLVVTAVCLALAIWLSVRLWRSNQNKNR